MNTAYLLQLYRSPKARVFRFQWRVNQMYLYGVSLMNGCLKKSLSTFKILPAVIEISRNEK